MKIDIKKLVRKNILDMKAYSSARNEYSGNNNEVFLDANENPFGTLNRYPDPYQKQLKEKLSQIKKVDTNNIFVGNGSDEIIDLMFRIFCVPSKDKALTFSPTYGMYQVSSDINNVSLIKIPLNNNFQIDRNSVASYFEDTNIKLLFICSPNNPTGNTIFQKDIEFILNNFKGIVIIDEAYIDFSEHQSLIHLIDTYPNLLVCQTLSKAWALAAARIGIAYSNKTIISLLNKVKPPYNVSALNQKAALETLNNSTVYKDEVSLILKEKQKLKDNLNSIKIVKKIYVSDANFILIKVENADEIYTKLISKNIIIRNRNKQIKNCLRITVGSPQENEKLIQALKIV